MGEFKAMTSEERKDLVSFCVHAIAYLNDVSIEDVEPNKFLNMTDEQLEKEADWLDNLLNK